MSLKLKVNEIVFFKKRNFISLACINELNKDQISVITEEGKQLNLQVDQIVYCSGVCSDKTANSSEIKLELRALRRQLDENKEKVDLKTIWDCVYDPQKSCGYNLQDIIELYTDKESSSLEKLQFVWALQRDEIYFKKQDGLIYLNTPSESEEIIKRKKETLRKDQEKEQALDWIKGAHDGTAEVNKEDIEKYSDYIELIKGYAVFIDKYERLKEAKALLNSVGIRDEIDALEFLINNGLWDKNEDPIFKRYGIKQTYPQKVINQSEKLVNKEVNYDKLLDITKLELISIDDENTTDIDDALSVEIMGDKTRVGVHISNVAAFIDEKDHLDNEALKRGETIYLAEGNISMFPSDLVTKLLTLSSKSTRKALSLFITFDPEFNISNYEFVQTKINVNKNISYNDANDNYLKTDQGSRLLAITNALRQKRVKNGAIILQLPTMKVELDGDKVKSLTKYSMTTDSHNVIAEFMILLNNLAAKYFAENKIPAVFRSQIESTSEEIKNLNRESEIFPVEVLRFLRPTKISTYAEPHKFLGIDAYVQISSPIRRYLDLVLQRQLVSCLNGTGPMYSNSALEKIYVRTEMAVKEKRTIEKSRERYWVLKYLLDNNIKEVAGFISSVRDRRVNVYIPEYLIDVALTPSADNQLEVGSAAKINITKIDLFRRKISASFID